MRLYIKLFHKNVFLFIRFSLMFSLKVSVTLIFLVYFTIIFSFFFFHFSLSFSGFLNALFACFRSARCDLISVTILIALCLKLSEACLQRFKSFNFGSRDVVQTVRARDSSRISFWRVLSTFLFRKNRNAKTEKNERVISCVPIIDLGAAFSFFRVLSLGFSREARRRTFKTINRWQVGAKYSSRR